MQNDTIGTNDQQNNNPDNLNKEYPGYAPDPQSGTTTDQPQDTEANDKDSAAKLAAKGPVRNPNYHTMDDKTHPGDYSNKNRRNVQHQLPEEKDGKTLEDFNETEPNRDINSSDTEQEEKTDYDNNT